jgi:hypothetical protein
MARTRRRRKLTMGKISPTAWKTGRFRTARPNVQAAWFWFSFYNVGGRPSHSGGRFCTPFDPFASPGNHPEMFDQALLWHATSITEARLIPDSEVPP